MSEDCSNKKDVFFIGAGFSKEYGLPLMKDLLDSIGQFYVKSYRFLADYSWLDDNEKKKIQLDKELEKDLEGINSVISGADSHIKNDIEKMLEYLENLKSVNKNLSKSLLVFLEWVLYLHTYHYFQQVKNNFCMKKEHYKKLLVNNNILITTNYDNLAEREHPKIAQNFTLPNEYCGYPTISYPLLLKLHGGHAYKKISGEEIIHIYTDENKKFISYNEMKGNSRDLGNDQFSQANSSYEQILVPPFFDKSLLYNKFKNHVDTIFKVAKDELRKASRIFIIGYSLPEADERVIKLFKENVETNQIYIVSPSPLKSTEKYKKIFTHGCKYISMTAGDFIAYYPKSLQTCFQKAIEIQ